MTARPLAAGILSLSLFYASALRAQTDIPTLHLSAELVLVDASVELRATGARIEDLTPADFILTDDDRPQVITYLSEDRIPLSVVFLFDVTDTVHPVVKTLATGTDRILAQLRPADEAAVMVFSSHARLIQDFTTDRSTLKKAIAKAASTYDPRTPTFILQDILEATQTVAHSTIPGGRRLTIWLTDGTANDTSKNPMRRQAFPAPPLMEADVRDTVLRSGVVMAGLIERSWLTYQSEPDFTATDSMGTIADFGALTGGPFLKTSQKEVAADFAALLNTLRHRYTLGFKPDTQKPPGTLSRLHLRMSPSFWRSHLNLQPSDLLILTRESYLR
jgi:VWFA-related protein